MYSTDDYRILFARLLERTYLDLDSRDDATRDEAWRWFFVPGSLSGIRLADICDVFGLPLAVAREKARWFVEEATPEERRALRNTLKSMTIKKRRMKE